ncbi:MAG TPA: flagellar hook capping protein, partial [Hyphomonas sp.]|nr:flagellar hook capping protein [Hyphomonas sp.]
MSTIESTTAAQTQTTASSAATQQFGEEFNNFIKLLTAQVQNQDP